MNTILPPNASQLQRDLEQAAGPSLQLYNAVDAISGIKYTPPDNLLPYLVWEYGLENLLPYLSDPRLAIQEGVQWQRIHGTPAALKLAMGWLGFNNGEIEAEVPGVHYYEYQIDSGKIVPTAELENVKAVAQYSAPLRSRLTRLYHDYDVRRLVLDHSEYGALLSDYSGIDKNGIKLSFGNQQFFAVDNTQASSSAIRIANHTSHTQDVHWPNLDDQPLGGEKTSSDRYSLRTIESSLTGQIWVGGWDQRLWNQAEYLAVGSAHKAN